MARRRILTDEERRYLVAHYPEQNVIELGAHLRCGGSLVSRTLREMGISVRPRVRPLRILTDEERRYLAVHYPEQGVIALGAHFRCSPGLVSHTLREMGIPVRRPGGTPKLAPAKRAAILAAWREGKAANAINAELGTSNATVKSVLADAGIPWENRLRRGPESPGWKNGRHYYGPDINGRYVAVWVGRDDPMWSMANRGGTVPEHRLVMARSLGRPLERHETVHHLNGRRDDNRLDNLQLRIGRHGKGVAMRCVECGSHNVEAVHI